MKTNKNSLNNEPTIVDQLSEVIAGALQEGNDPKIVVTELLNNGFLEYDIKEALYNLGANPDEIETLFSPVEPVVAKQQMPEEEPEYVQEEEEEEVESDVDKIKFNIFGNYMDEMKYGGIKKAQGGVETNNYLKTFLQAMEQPEDPGIQNTMPPNLNRLNYETTSLQTMDNYDPSITAGLIGQEAYQTKDSAVAQNQTKDKNKSNSGIDLSLADIYGGVSNALVQGSRAINYFMDRNKQFDAKNDAYKMTQADRSFGVLEDPVNKRGMWDVNTGLAEQNNYVPFMKKGGQIEELDLDTKTIAELIAAGADIEIL